MHRRASAKASFLGCLLVGLAGCVAEAPTAAPIRRIFVEEAVGAPLPELARSAGVIHDTAVRTLRARGFVAAAEPSEADATLRSAWFVRPAETALPAGRVTLRMALVSREGAVLQGAEVIADVPAGFLSDERIADAVRAKLATFPR